MVADLAARYSGVGREGREEPPTPSADVVRAGASSLTFGFDVIRDGDGALCARARVTNAVIDRRTMRAIPCPEDLKTLFLRYCESD